jgi:DNA polymerase III delta subunit
MIHVIVGPGKSPQATDLKWEDISIEELGTLASTPTLFGGPQTYKLVGAIAGERGDEFLDLADGLVESPHTFIFEEEKLLKRPTDILKKAGAKIEIHEAKKKEETFNMFALATVFGTRDRKKLWLMLNKASRAGAAPEAVAGMLHWKVRDMMGKGSAAYTKEELGSISRTLVTLYHDSHRGAGDLELLLERFALRL